ncbi:hypothetical protein GLAREA_06022 [Glarea lozoyensis ATCC 20868]|uniref:C2H2-type domain-containing protein n=1 Tax=Glarea lozoyensis (strain ATCC 20868 / MF5171) TaxID=1116229 RepID=S3D5F4_GLAL2|nr:uncharacterized protein GLAREA_06022 [Glarea lozoyensis ATCC 20868]EPE33010.1 hypothetical protein GLAREA_06022 [Glarea lozoyensis ATCC 20868]
MGGRGSVSLIPAGVDRGGEEVPSFSTSYYNGLQRPEDVETLRITEPNFSPINPPRGDLELYSATAGLQLNNISPNSVSVQALESSHSVDLGPAGDEPSATGTTLAPTVDSLQPRSSTPLDSGSSPKEKAVPQIGCTWPLCIKSFSSMADYNHHFKNHSKPFLCTICPARHATKRHLDRHVNERHSNVENYFCSVLTCKRSRAGGQPFRRVENCRRHVVKVHQLCDASMDGLDMDEETRRVREGRKKGKR